jgi:hypothetical protein
MKKLLEAGFLTWFLGGGFILFLVVLFLLKVC